MIDNDMIIKAGQYMSALYAMENTAFTGSDDGSVLVNGQPLFKLPDATEAAKLVDELKAAVGPVVGAHIASNRQALLDLLSNA